jgi:hypothetical protein
MWVAGVLVCSWVVFVLLVIMFFDGATKKHWPEDTRRCPACVVYHDGASTQCTQFIAHAGPHTF